MSHKLLDRMFRDKDGHIAVWQMPNFPLWVWIISTVLGWFIQGKPKTIVGYIGSAALVVWAVLEIGWGSSWFRRLLGAVVLAVMAVGMVVKFRR